MAGTTAPLKTASDKGFLALDEDPIRTLINRDVAGFINAVERRSRIPRQYDWTIPEYVNVVKDRLSFDPDPQLCATLNTVLYGPGMRSEAQRKSLLGMMGSFLKVVKEAEKAAKAAKKK